MKLETNNSLEFRCMLQQWCTITLELLEQPNPFIKERKSTCFWLYSVKMRSCQEKTRKHLSCQHAHTEINQQRAFPFVFPVSYFSEETNPSQILFEATLYHLQDRLVNRVIPQRSSGSVVSTALRIHKSNTGLCNIIKYSERLSGPLLLRMCVINLRSQQQQTTAAATYSNDHTHHKTQGNHRNSLSERWIATGGSLV